MASFRRKLKKARPYVLSTRASHIATPSAIIVVPANVLRQMYGHVLRCPTQLFRDLSVSLPEPDYCV